MHTQAIHYAVRGVDYIGYHARPDQPRAGAPAILIAHEGNGLGPQIKVRAEQLAELGYLAFAVDYVGGGEVMPDLQAALARLGYLRGHPELVLELAQAGLDQLLALPGVDPARVAAIGYCFGGTFVLELARAGARLAATVGFHAGLKPMSTTPPAISGAVLACIGADDPLVPPEDRAAFEREMREAKVADWQLEVYGNAVHGFANPAVDRLGNPALRYHQAAHHRSWRSMLGLFDEVFAAPAAAPAPASTAG
jgi:dienelactone hydrolase